MSSQLTPLSKAGMAVTWGSLGLDLVHTHSVPNLAACWKDSLHSDDTQLLHSFLTPGGNPSLGLGWRAMDEHAQIVFLIGPGALNCNLSLIFHYASDTSVPEADNVFRLGG